MTSNLEWALFYTSKGWAVFPCNQRKEPLTKHGFKNATNDAKKVTDFFTEFPYANIAVATGDISKVFLLDIDIKKGNTGDKSLKDLIDIHGGLPFTPSARSWSGGLHYFFKNPDWEMPSISFIAPGIEIKANGGYAILPPSIYKGDLGEGEYSWIPGASPFEVEMAEAPFWLLEMAFEKYIQKNLPQANSYENMIEGNINNVISKLNIKFRKIGNQLMGSHPIHGSTNGGNFVVHPEKNVWKCFRCGSGGGILHLIAVLEGIITCDQSKPGGLTGEKFKKTLQIANEKYGISPLKSDGDSYKFTDQWNAWLFNECTKGMFKACRNDGLWYHFKGTHFVPDSFQDAYNEMRKIMTDIMDKKISQKEAKAKLASEEEKIDLEKKIKNLIHYKKSSLGHMKIHHCLEAAKSFPKVELKSMDFDTDQFLINCLNGTLDLRTMKLLPHNPNHLITKIAKVNYNPDADCPNFKAFLNTIFESKKHIIDYVLRCLGYGLCGSVSEQVFFILYGGGSNGKNTLVDTVKYILNDYSGSIEPVSLLESSSDSNAALSERASLMGKRFVTTNEPKEMGNLDMSFIKKLTSMDDIGAKFMRQDVFYYKPTAKLFICTNYKPDIKDTDIATWRRIHYWPFLYTFPPSEIDPDFAIKYLYPEIDGIFNLLVKGYIQYKSDGLAMPLDIMAAKEQYKRSANSVQQFIDEECTLDENYEIPKVDLFHAYQDYMKPYKIKKSWFYEECTKIGFLDKKSRKGCYEGSYVFLGLTLSNDCQNKF